MRPRQPLRHIAEKALQFRLDAVFSIDRLGSGEILGAGLLADPQHLAKAGRQRSQGGRHDLAHDPRPLAAAEDQQLDRIAALRRLVPALLDGEHRRPHRVSDMDGAAAVGGAQARRRRETGGDPPGARRQQTIGAAEDRVLLVDRGRQTEISSRKHRRDRGIAAEADDAGGGKPAQQSSCLQDPQREFAQRVRGVRRPAPESPGAHMMDLDPGNPSGKGLGPQIGEKVDLTPAAQKLDRQRLGREQMPAGAAGSEHIGRAHSPLPPSRRRVSASIIPMPRPSASSDDPP